MPESTMQSDQSNKVGKSAIGLGVGLLAAVLASLCCVGPLALGLLGLGALAAFLSRYSLAFGIAAAVLLAVGGWLLMRRAHGGSGDAGSCCSTERGGTSASRAVLLMVAGFAALWVVARYAVVPALAGLSAPVGSVLASTVKPGARIASLDIRGMDCAGCVGGLTAVLKSKPGVLSARVEYPQHRGTVVYEPARIQVAAIVKTLQEMGYQVKILQDRPAHGQRTSALSRLLGAGCAPGAGCP